LPLYVRLFQGVGGARSIFAQIFYGEIEITEKG
jgi:hypothetical protein